jgi:carbonic anhydrase/acetyltransferase-like protein (isoleucine patch superfamily)
MAYVLLKALTKSAHLIHHVLRVTMTLSKLTTAALITVLTLSTSGCIIHVGGQDNHDNNKTDFSSVFGGVDVSENKQVGDLSSVNGNITIQDNVSASDVNAINGNIEIGNNVKVHELSTVNGDIQTQTYLSVIRDISTVNGNITLGSNSMVGKDITTVNGDISLTQTFVSDDIKTKNGNITLVEGSVVEGDIEFESKYDGGWWSDTSLEHSPPVLTIDGTSDVKGKIILRQIVVLNIENPSLLAKVEHSYRNQE